MNKKVVKDIEARKNKAVEMIGKKLEMRISRKAISIDAENKTATFVMSTCNVDRHGDIIDQDSWMLDYFLQSPMFFLQHNSSDFPIGGWSEVHFEDDPENPGKKMLVGTAKFATDIYDQADLAFKMVEAGFMNAVSVGFIPHVVEYDENTDCFVLKECELLECSLVGIGSNRQALVKGKEDAEIRNDIIETKKELDARIEKIVDKNRVISHLKARESLNKAIRRMQA